MIARSVETAPDEMAIAKAHAIYTPVMLSIYDVIYDVLVYGLSNRLALGLTYVLHCLSAA